MTISSFEFGELTGLLAAVAWGAIGLLVRAHGVGVHGIVINALRCAISGLVFVVIWPFASSLHALPPAALVFLGASTLTGLGLGDTLYFEALKRIGVARAMPISMGYPVLVSIGAVTLLHESMGPLSVLGMLITLVGVYLVAVRPEASAAIRSASRYQGGYWSGIGLAAAAAVSWSCSTLALRPALDLVDVATAAAVRTPVASALLFAAAARGGVLPKIEDLVHRRALMAIIVTGVMSVAATGLFLVSVTLAGAGRAAVLNATAPVFAVPLSIWLLGERGSLRVVLGTLASVFGVILLAQR